MLKLYIFHLILVFYVFCGRNSTNIKYNSHAHNYVCYEIKVCYYLVIIFALIDCIIMNLSCLTHISKLLVS